MDMLCKSMIGKIDEIPSQEYSQVTPLNIHVQKQGIWPRDISEKKIREAITWGIKNNNGKPTLLSIKAAQLFPNVHELQKIIAEDLEQMTKTKKKEKEKEQEKEKTQGQ